MKVTLINTIGTVDVARRTKSGDVETLGSFEVSVGDPAFISSAQALVASLDLGADMTTVEYEQLRAQCIDLIYKAATNADDVRAIMGDAPSLFDALALLTAVLQEAARIDALGQIEQLQEEMLLPDNDILTREMALS